MHFLFDPTAPGQSKDRVWRYVGFIGLDVATLRQILTDKAAIEAYKQDPFNPHAIARLRPSAYQKHLVMRYVDNLLDWADSLFTQFTTESINEAVLIYTLAADILGERPPRLGACGETTVPRTYEAIKPALSKGSEFLAEFETWFGEAAPVNSGQSASFGASASALVTAKDPNRRISARQPVLNGPGKTRLRTAAWKSPGSMKDKGIGAGVDAQARIAAPKAQYDSAFSWSVVRQISPVFCVPPNKELLAYWDRVDDRLGKIRSCRDINGIKRLPPLFAPEIDPRLLVRAKALGLSLDDVVGATAGSLPPYRFLYLIQKAKEYAASTASFGGALLSALEKKDNEQLNRLRLVQQQNIAKLTTQVRRWEIQVAEEGLAGVERQIEAAQYRLDYFGGLIESGRSGWEVAQSAATHTANIITGTVATARLLASILFLLPQIGSLFAVTHGGKQEGENANASASMIKDTVDIAKAIASSSALEAGFDRREEGWEHTKKLAEHDLKALDRQKKIAELRLEIANRSLELHEESIEQIEETFAFYEGKFTNLGLYTWLATTLQRVYRGAYNNALALARLADEAFRYERGTSEFLIDASYWDASRAGLGAGEQLMLALQTLERRFIETHHRSHEVDQAFSLQQVAPAALLELRKRGDCTFKIPELFFDLAYPGHYRRRIKAVRLTIPCITGPYVNIGAMLSLTHSQIRSEASGTLVDFPVRRTNSVATSTAQNDAGVFELSFRDERYMPFEGAGAISEWRLELPSTFRSFDYTSINDVILSISYTAEYDGALRDQVQEANGALERSLMSVLRTNPVSRVVSLRHDFSAAFNRILHAAAGTAVSFDLGDAQLPFFLAGRAITVTDARLVVELAPGALPGTLSLGVDGTSLTLAAQTELGGMLGDSLPGAFRSNFKGTHTLTVLDGGDLRPASLPGDPSALDESKVLDILLSITFRLA